MKKQIIICCLIGFIFGTVLSSIINADENIIWKFNDDSTVEDCINETNQSIDICEAIIKMIKQSKRYGKIIIKTNLGED